MTMTSQSKKRRRRTRVLMITVAVVAVLVLVVKYGASVWLNGQRASLEQGLGQASGLQAKIKGKISATVWPTPGISLEQIELERNGKPFTQVREFRTDFELWPLLDRRFVPHTVDIHGLTLTLDENEAGAPLLAMVQHPGTDGKPSPSKSFGVDLPDKIVLHDANISVRSADGKILHQVNKLYFAVHPIRDKAALLKSSDRWLLALYLNVEQARLGPLNVGPSKLTAEYGPYRITTRVTETALLGGTATGTASWLSATDTPGVKATFRLNQFNAEESVALFRPSSFVRGKLDLDAEFSSAGTGPGDWLQHLSGTVKLTGKDIDLVTIDLDKLVAEVINSRKYNLADAAAYFFIGPLAVTATKGIDVARLASIAQSPGNTVNQITQLVSKWKIADGVAVAEDVALSTRRYRLALRGRINLVKQEFMNVEIAVINQRGCAIASQRLDGSVTSPRLEKTNLLMTLARPMIDMPVVDVLVKTAEQSTGSDCKPFYQGELLRAATADPA